MPREVSDDEWNRIQAKVITADFVESIWNNPKFNPEAKALVKKAYPDLEMPVTAADIDQRIAAQKHADEAARAAAAKAAREKAEDDAWKAQRADVQKERGLTDEAMTDLDKWMFDNKVGDYRVAADYRASKTPRPVEAYQDQFWQHDKAPGFKEIAEDPEGWARKEILNSIYRGQEQMRRG